MADILSNLFKRRRAKKDKAPMPVLPDERPRPLTPSPSCQSLNISGSAESSFFQRLPIEIRRKVLIEAFGGRTVHMDLFFDHPMLPKPASDGPTHCDLNANQGHTKESPLKLDMSLPKQWAWRSSVCHRCLPGSSPADWHAQATRDKCRFGDADAWCKFWPGNMPEKCFIGAMGWLLSCRQAYLEGVDVLYSTNVIHTASKEMMMNLRQLLVPQRLSALTSVELVWECAPFEQLSQASFTSPLSSKASLRSFLKAVPEAFPAVKFLYISIFGNLFPHEVDGHTTTKDERFEMTEEVVMLPVDNMVRMMGSHLHECSIAIPSSMYADRRDRARDAGQPVEHNHITRQWERHWRPLVGSCLSGYWVQLGQKDRRYPFACSMGQALPKVGADEDWILFGFD